MNRRHSIFIPHIRDGIPYTYKSTGNIIVLFISITINLKNKLEINDLERKVVIAPSVDLHLNLHWICVI